MFDIATQKIKASGEIAELFCFGGGAAVWFAGTVHGTLFLAKV